MKHKISHKKYNGHRVYRDVYDPLNPLDLPPYTLRLKFIDNYTPTFSKGTAVQVSSSPNVWDWTYVNSNWQDKYQGTIKWYLLEVLGGNTTGVTSMRDTFSNCWQLTSINIFDTSTVTDMYNMFNGCDGLATVPLFDTSNVTNMNRMFYNCKNLTYVPLFDTSIVTDMFEMFSNCWKLTTINIFDTSNVSNMNGMFSNCTSLTSVPLLNTNNVTDMGRMFQWCKNVQSGALALYQQASTQPNPPREHYYTFNDCGINTQTGSAELSQIPGDWK